MTRARAALALLLLIAGALPSGAQICAGRPSFNLASTRFEIDAAVNASGRGIGVAAGHGTDTLFGVGAAATYRSEGFERVTMIAGAVGTDQPLTPDNKFHVCPIVAVGIASAGAPDGEMRAGFSAGGDIAMLAVSEPGLIVIPTIGLELSYNGVGRSAGLLPHGPRRRYGTLSAAVGVVFRNRLTLAPRLVVPLGPLDRTGVQITIAYSVPRR